MGTSEFPRLFRETEEELGKGKVVFWVASHCSSSRSVAIYEGQSLCYTPFSKSYVFSKHALTHIHGGYFYDTQYFDFQNGKIYRVALNFQQEI